MKSRLHEGLDSVSFCFCLVGKGLVRSCGVGRWEMGRLDDIPDYDAAPNAPLTEFTFPRTPKREFVAAFFVVLPIFDFADALVRPGGYGSKSCQPKNRK